MRCFMHQGNPNYRRISARTDPRDSTGAMHFGGQLLQPGAGAAYAAAQHLGTLDLSQSVGGYPSAIAFQNTGASIGPQGYGLTAAPTQNFIALSAANNLQGANSTALYGALAQPAQQPHSHMYTTRVAANAYPMATLAPTTSQLNTNYRSGGLSQPHNSVPSFMGQVEQDSSPLPLSTSLAPFLASYDNRILDGPWEFIDEKGVIHEERSADELLSLMACGKISDTTLVRTAGNYWTILKLVADLVETPRPARVPEKQHPNRGSSQFASQNQALQLFSAGHPSAAEPAWWYIDNNRKIQGPYAVAKILDWYCAGYFTQDMQMVGVCSKVNSNSPPPRPFFKPLRLLLQLIRNGQNYTPARDADLVHGRPPPGWNDPHNGGHRQGVEDMKGRPSLMHDKGVYQDRDGIARASDLDFGGGRGRGRGAGRGNVVQGWGGLPVNVNFNGRSAAGPSSSAVDTLQADKSIGNFAAVDTETLSQSKAQQSVTSAFPDAGIQLASSSSATKSEGSWQAEEGSLNAGQKRATELAAGKFVAPSALGTPARSGASKLLGASFWGGQTEAVDLASLQASAFQPQDEDCSFDVTAYASAAAVRALQTSFGLLGTTAKKVDGTDSVNAVVDTAKTLQTDGTDAVNASGCPVENAAATPEQTGLLCNTEVE